jgi:hypothetical protein
MWSQDFAEAVKLIGGRARQRVSWVRIRHVHARRNMIVAVQARAMDALDNGLLSARRLTETKRSIWVVDISRRSWERLLQS